MPLQKIQLRPGLNREGTDYSNEGGYFDGDKIRFRSGFPEKLGGWIRLSASRFLGALHVSPLQRAQETAAPIAAAHKIAITTDERLIEAANVFEGKPFGVGDGVLKHPSSWRHLWNPWKPSWGEPYDQQINRMLAAVFAARDAANGKDAIVVSHQLPIWILRSAIENRRLLHDPRRRECSLASVTSVHFDDEGFISGLTYSEPARHLLPKKN
jgi:broad specificity phosphatase PhoE